MEAAHSHGILHRDIKPANILITDYGEPALSDFGIAHITGGFETTTGVVTGSPAYTAPEILTGDPLSPSADVYGLGATLFVAITGHAAFERRSGEHLMAQFLRIASEPAPNPREHGVPEDVSAIIELAMAGDPATRPSAAELSRYLRESQLRHGFAVDETIMHTTEPGTESGAVSARVPSAQDAWPSPSWSADSGRGNRLPLELTTFVDRHTELTEATNALSTSRLLTLTGIGGVGKTRLALRIATTMRDHFSDGVTLVELAELRDELLLAGVVVNALGLRDQSARPIREVLVNFLADREKLLILDNCEQLVAAAAKLTDTLLRACPRLRILTTSREPLGIGGEVVLLVPPLDVPDPDHLPMAAVTGNDAVTLFAERGAAAVPGFEVTEDNKVAIARICQRLDGLPLPIEFAAARLRTMTPEQILQCLTDRYRLLTRGNRDAPSRQQTLRMCIDWSYDLCTAAEQRLWAQLSVFAGSFDLDAAEHLTGPEPTTRDLLDTLTGLVDKSILTRETAGETVRFWMLETVRDYGRERAQESSDYTELARRHRDWYERLVLDVESQLISSRELALISMLVREHPNLRDALEFCIRESPDSGLRIVAALYPFWLSRGLLGEGRRWLDRLLVRPSGAPTADRAKALYVGSMMAGVQGDLHAAAVLVDDAHALAARTGDRLIRAHTDSAVGYAALFGERPLEARAHLEKAVQAYTGRNDVVEVAALIGLGWADEFLGDTAKAIECYERVLAITDAQGESVFRSYSLWGLAVAVWRRGELERAIQLLDQALRIDRRVNDRLNASMCLQAMAWISAEDAQWRRAVVLMGAAETLSRSVGSPIVVLSGLIGYQDMCERNTRGALSAEVFAAARQDGAGLSFDGAVAYALGAQLPGESRSGTPAAPLTKREQEIADLVAAGLTNKQAAARLAISPRTVQGHVQHILTKRGLTSRAQIAAWMTETRRSNS